MSQVAPPSRERATPPRRAPEFREGSAAKPSEHHSTSGEPGEPEIWWMSSFGPTGAIDHVAPPSGLSSRPPTSTDASSRPRLPGGARMLRTAPARGEYGRNHSSQPGSAVMPSSPAQERPPSALRK